MTRITTDLRGSDHKTDLYLSDPWESAAIRGNPRSSASASFLKAPAPLTERPRYIRVTPPRYFPYRAGLAPRPPILSLPWSTFMATRREFLADVGRGMLVASVGPAVATDLGLSPAFADAPDTLSFGKLEPLAAFLQDTPLDRLQPALVEKLKDGTDLRTLVAAGALANAR